MPWAARGLMCRDCPNTGTRTSEDVSVNIAFEILAVGHVYVYSYFACMVLGTRPSNGATCMM